MYRVEKQKHAQKGNKKWSKVNNKVIEMLIQLLRKKDGSN